MSSVDNGGYNGMNSIHAGMTKTQPIPQVQQQPSPLQRPPITQSPTLNPRQDADSPNQPAKPTVKPEDSKTEPAEPATPSLCEDTASLLVKYAKSPPSLELHIHQTHYRFSGQEGIIPKNNPVMDMFLKGVQEGILPPAASEVFRDSGITLYEGCAILKLVDFRNFSSHAAQQKRPDQDFDKTKPGNAGATGVASTMNTAGNTANTATTTDGKPAVRPGATPGDSADPGDKPAPPHTKQTPPSFRVLLKPTNGTLLNDLMGLSDAGTGRRLTDLFAISMESEILNATVRHLDLRRPKRHEYDAGLHASLKLTELKRKAYFKHRLTHPRKIHRLVEESPHKGTAYEDFMLGMADLERPSRGSSQFVRMSFIEQLRRKKNINPPGTTAPAAQTVAARANLGINSRASAGSAGAGSSSGVAPNAGSNNSGSGSGAGNGTASSLNLEPTQISQPSPSQLGKQLFQSQQMAQQSTRLQQQALVQQLAMNHVPPGPTAQHQIQAQQQQQAILRAKAQQQQQQQQQQMVRQMSPQAGQRMPIPTRPATVNAGPQVSGGNAGGNNVATATMTSAATPAGIGSATPSQQHMPVPNNVGGNPQMMSQMSRPLSSMGQTAAAGQRIARPMSQMNKANGMPMGQVNMIGNNMAMNNQMNNQMNSQMNNQMSPQLNNQMSPQMNQLNRQMTNHRTAQMNNQLAGQMNNQMNHQMGMPSPHMGGQMNNVMGVNHMGMNQAGMNKSMSPTGSPIQAPNRLNQQMPVNGMNNMNNMGGMPQQMQQQMQGRRPQLTQAQIRQIMMNRARAQQAQQQAQQQQQAQHQQQQ